MRVVSAVFNNDTTGVSITMSDGSIWADDASNPPDNQVRRLLAEWLSEGGEIAAFTPPPAPIPNLTRRQLRLWLLRQEIPTSAVEALIDALPEPARSEARIEWADASAYERGNPLIHSIGSALGLTAEQMDQGFRDAALI